MKQVLTGLFLLLLAGWGIGQRAAAQDIFYSKEQKFTFQNGDFSVVGWSGDRLYTYRASKEGYYLDAYNDSMRLMATIALDFFPQKIYETRFFTTENNIVVFYQAVQRNQVVQYAALLDNRARMLQKPLVLDSAKMSWMSSDRKYYSVAVSSDKSRFMIFSVGSRKDRRVACNTILLDDNMRVLSRRTVHVSSEDEFSFGQSLLGKDGTFYLAAYNAGAGGMAGSVWLLKLAPEAADFSVKPFPLNDNFLSGMYMKLDDSRNQVFVGAFYSEKKSGNLDGILYALYDPAGESLSTFRLIPFDEAMRNASSERNKKKAFNDFEVRNLILKNDGGFILVSENYYVTTRTSNYGTGYGYYSWYNNTYPSSSTREYHYGDIMVLDYNGEGERQWQNFIRKEQYSQEDDGLFSSYVMLNSGATLVFLFNDFSSSKSTLNLAAVDADGSLQMKKMNPGRTAGADWLPRAAKQTDLRELLVPVLRKNSLGFARVVF